MIEPKGFKDNPIGFEDKFERVDSLRVKLRVKYLTSLINKMYKGEKLTPKQYQYFNKYCQIKNIPN